jgi:hypothetical protein
MNKLLVLFFAVVFTPLIYAQVINLQDPVNCFIGPDVAVFSGSDGGNPQRNIYQGIANNGSFPFQVIWSTANMRWEVQADLDANGTYETIAHMNTTASAPNPPGLSFGGWTDLAGCGTLSQFDGSGTQVGLPVELSFFEANSNNEQIVFTWRTLSERDNDRFEIEELLENNDFMKVGTVHGNGNSLVPIDYKYHLGNSIHGIRVFRLKQIDVDGKFVYSENVSIHGNKGDAIVSWPIFRPNRPNSLFFHINVENDEEFTISLLSITGEIVLDVKRTFSNQTNSFELELEQAPAGLYVVLFQSRQGLFQRKVILPL